jgi:hypothetical protein
LIFSPWIALVKWSVSFWLTAGHDQGGGEGISDNSHGHVDGGCDSKANRGRLIRLKAVTNHYGVELDPAEWLGLMQGKVGGGSTAIGGNKEEDEEGDPKKSHSFVPINTGCGSWFL